MALRKFITEIKNRGVARSSHYVCEIVPPAFLTVDNTTVNILTLFCEQAMFPELALATSTIKDYGLNREVVYDKMYGVINLTFTCDQQMLIKQFFDQWVGGTVYNKGGVFVYPDAYQSPEIRIHQVNAAREIVYSVAATKAYPKIVNDIIVSANSKDYNRFQVQFTYEEWHSRTLSDSTGMRSPTQVMDYGGGTRMISGISATIPQDGSVSGGNATSVQSSSSYALATQPLVLGTTAQVLSDRFSLLNLAANQISEQIRVGYASTRPETLSV